MNDFGYSSQIHSRGIAHDVQSAEGTETQTWRNICDLISIALLIVYLAFLPSGIVPSLIITAVSALLFSNYYVRRIKYDRVKLTLKEIYREANPMVKMGVALMFVSFAGALFNLIIVAYIRSQGGLEEVGFYSAGVIIIANYFGVVLTAMTTDYYPRISAVHEDNTKLQEEMNRQSEVGLILIFPLFMFLFVFFID